MVGCEVVECVKHLKSRGILTTYGMLVFSEIQARIQKFGRRLSTCLSCGKDEMFILQTMGMFTVLFYFIAVKHRLWKQKTLVGYRFFIITFLQTLLVSQNNRVSNAEFGNRHKVKMANWFVGLRPPTRILQPALFWAILSSCFKLLFVLFMFASNSRRSVFLGLSLFCISSEFKVSACFVVQLSDFRNENAIHFQRLFLVSSSARSLFCFLQNQVVVDSIRSIEIQYLEQIIVCKDLNLYDDSCSISPSFSSIQQS